MPVSSKQQQPENTPFAAQCADMSLHGDYGRLSDALLGIQVQAAHAGLDVPHALHLAGIATIQLVKGTDSATTVTTNLLCGAGSLGFVATMPAMSASAAKQQAYRLLGEALGFPPHETRDEAHVGADELTPSARQEADKFEGVTTPEPAQAQSTSEAATEDAKSNVPQPTATAPGADSPQAAPSQPAADAQPHAESQPRTVTPPEGLTEGERNQISRLKAAVDGGTCTLEKARISLSEGGVSFQRLSSAALAYARALILGPSAEPAVADIDPALGY